MGRMAKDVVGSGGSGGGEGEAGVDEGAGAGASAVAVLVEVRGVSREVSGVAMMIGVRKGLVIVNARLRTYSSELYVIPKLIS